MLHGTLWNENAELVRRCLEHPFVRRLGAGTLERDAFRRYVAQDAFFLRTFYRVYGLAATRCDEFDHARLFHELMVSVLDELKLHANYANLLDINLDDVQPYAATSAYTEFLLHIAWHNSVAEIIAAMVSCIRLYTHLGNELTNSLRPQYPYEGWIKTYSGDEFRQLCVRVESLSDEVASDCPAVRDVYRYAMQCELDFFSTPLENEL